MQITKKKTDNRRTTDEMHTCAAAQQQQEAEAAQRKPESSHARWEEWGGGLHLRHLPRPTLVVVAMLIKGENGGKQVNKQHGGLTLVQQIR